MKTSNSGRTLMTPGVTAAPFSEAMPLHPQNGDEVIAVNVGSSTYTLTGSITGGDVVLDAGETSILVYVGSAAGWVVTWRSETGTVTYPISIAHGGTGIDATDLFAWVAANAETDTATSTFYMSATDSGANVFNASVGIELPNSVGVAGDLVIRTGGTGASGSGTERVRVSGASGIPTFTFNDGVSMNISAIGAATSVPSATTGIVFHGTDSAGGGVSPIIGTLDALDKVLHIGPTEDPSGGLFIAAPAASNGAILVDFTGNGYVTPVADFQVNGTTSGLFANSLSGISALFQTGATDGSNTNPTQVIAGNTGQTAPLTEWRGVDGTTVVQSVSVEGGFDYPIIVSGVAASTFYSPVDFLGAPVQRVNQTPSDTAKALYQATVTNVSVATDTVSFGARATAGGSADFIVETQAGEVFRIVGAGFGDVVSGANIDAASFSVSSAPGITDTVTTASLVGKTITITNGLITGFA